MAWMKGGLQRLGSIEVKVDSMMAKLTVLERMEQLLLKWEILEKNTNPEGKIGTREPQFSSGRVSTRRKLDKGEANPTERNYRTTHVGGDSSIFAIG